MGSRETCRYGTTWKGHECGNYKAPRHCAQKLMPSSDQQRLLRGGEDNLKQAGRGGRGGSAGRGRTDGEQLGGWCGHLGEK